jgi:hypothetical protein
MGSFQREGREMEREEMESLKREGVNRLFIVVPRRLYFPALQ